jgi:hypothetical protein
LDVRVRFPPSVQIGLWSLVISLLQKRLETND